MAMTLHVSGMTCGGCSSSVEKAIQALDPTATIEIDLATGEVSVTSSNLTIDAITEAIDAAGFDVGGATGL